MNQWAPSHYSPGLFSRTPCFTLPTSVFPKNFNTGSVNLPSKKSFLTEVFPGLDLLLLIPSMNHLRPLHIPPSAAAISEHEISPASFPGFLK